MANLLIAIACLFFFWKRSKRYLRYLQQEEYDTSRFFHWWLAAHAWDIKGTSVSLVSACLAFFAPLIAVLTGSLSIAVVGALEEDPTREGKILLKLTERARRVLYVAYAFQILLQVGCIALLEGMNLWIAEAFLIQLIPMTLACAVWLLQKDENRRQAQFLLEAKQVLAKVSPFVIGITGSYGKTSTKAALGQILQTALGPTFWPGKSINTPMGITREIRSNLQEGYRYAIIEMGAYQQGSIRRLCDLTPPHAAIITAVGCAHLERFGSPEAVYKGKSELAQAIPEDGILVCNGDNPGARRMAHEFPKKTTLLYGLDPQAKDLDCQVTHYALTEQGTTFTLLWKGKEYQGQTPLLGRTALSNVLASFTMACALGAQPEFVLAVIRNLEPVDNRLEVKREDEVVYLRDAYNSNPAGFEAALEVMQAFPAKRKILMTPGMIELGNEQYAENKKIGLKAAQICDLAIIVGPTNRESLLTGLSEGGIQKDQLVLCDTRSAAFEQLAALHQAGDAILIENDLPDLYEAPARF